MSEQNSRDDLEQACIDGNIEACRILGRPTPMKHRGMKMSQGGLLADSSKTWKMEATYPEFQKGIASSLQNKNSAQPVEEKFMYSPLQTGYAEGGEVDMDTTGSMLTPEIPLNFEDEVPMDDIMMEDESGLSPEQEEVLQQATSDYPELEEILNILGEGMSTSEFTDEFTGEGQVEGPGTGTSDSIPAQLSDGEFVFTAKAVKQLGVDKLRKMMSKAEMDYNDGEERQEFAQMGDEGFAAGGYSLMKKPSYAQGGRIRDSKLGFGGSRFTKAQINQMIKTFGEGFMKNVKPDGRGMYRVRGMAEGGTVERHMNANQAESNEGFGSKIFNFVAKGLNDALGRPVDAMINYMNTPENTIDPDTDYEAELAEKTQAAFVKRNREEADAQMARDKMLKGPSLLDGKDF